MDWKDALSALDPSVFPEGKGEETSRPEGREEMTESRINIKREKLNIFYEKKGRAGKPATIITGFGDDEAELLELARMLKQKLGCGGSARGGEILLQGDRREQARKLLQEKGFRF